MGATFPKEFADKIWTVLDFGYWLRLIYEPNRGMGDLRILFCKTDYLRRSVQQAWMRPGLIFLYICFGFAKYLLRDCAISKDRQKEKPIASTMYVTNGSQPFDATGSCPRFGRSRIMGQLLHMGGLG